MSDVTGFERRRREIAARLVIEPKTPPPELSEPEKPKEETPKPKRKR